MRKRTAASLALVVAFLAISRPCSALMSIEKVSRERARALGMAVRFQGNGPATVWVELEFRPEGKLKDFQHVSLEIRDGEKLLVGYNPLREKRSGSGSVVVGFLADRAYLDKVTLSVVTGVPTDLIGHELRLKEFLDPGKLP